MKRARCSLLGLSGLILLGTVVLWVGTRGTTYSWVTKSLPGERALRGWVGGGRISFAYLDLKEYPEHQSMGEGFESYSVDESDPEVVGERTDLKWDTPVPAFVYARCPVWFPGAVVGGLLLG